MRKDLPFHFSEKIPNGRKFEGISSLLLINRRFDVNVLWAFEMSWMVKYFRVIDAQCVIGFAPCCCLLPHYPTIDHQLLLSTNSRENRIKIADESMSWINWVLMGVQAYMIDRGK